MQRQQRIIIERCARSICAHIYPSAICHADMRAEHAEQRSITNWYILLQNSLQIVPLHIRWNRYAKIRQQRRRKVDSLHQSFPAFSCCSGSRIPNKQRRVRQFFIKQRTIFRPPSMLSQQKAVVGRHDEHGVLPHPVYIHVIEQFAQICITHGQQCTVLIAAVHLCSQRFRHMVIRRPIKPRPIIVIRIAILILFRRKKRLMRIKGFDMQQPVIRITVFIQEFMRQAEHLLQRLLSQSADIGTVDFILLICLPQMRRQFHCTDMCLPRITFLSSHALP